MIVRSLATALALICCALMAGCSSAHLTEAGSTIVTMSSANSGEVLAKCSRLGVVQGDSDTVFGGAYGQPQAIANARNKAGGFPGADTLVYNNAWEDFSGSHIAGVVYKCSGPQRVELVPPRGPDEMAQKTDTDGDASSDERYRDLEKAKKLRDQGILTEQEYEAEKRKILDRP